MKSVKDYIAELFEIDRCVSEMSCFHLFVELMWILALVILFSLPAIVWGS